MKPEGFIHLLFHLPPHLLPCSIQFQVLAILKDAGQPRESGVEQK